MGSIWLIHPVPISSICLIWMYRKESASVHHHTPPVWHTIRTSPGHLCISDIYHPISWSGLTEDFICWVKFNNTKMLQCQHSLLHNSLSDGSYNLMFIQMLCVLWECTQLKYKNKWWVNLCLFALLRKLQNSVKMSHSITFVKALMSTGRFSLKLILYQLFFGVDFFPVQNTVAFMGIFCVNFFSSDFSHAECTWVYGHFLPAASMSKIRWSLWVFCCDAFFTEEFCSGFAKIFIKPILEPQYCKEAVISMLLQAWL